MTSSAIVKCVPRPRRHWAGLAVDGDFTARPWDTEGDYDETYPARTPPPEIALEAVHRTMLDRIRAPRFAARGSMAWRLILLAFVVLIELAIVFAFMSSVWLRYLRGQA